jgi:hypothetical protein
VLSQRHGGCPDPSKRQGARMCSAARHIYTYMKEASVTNADPQDEQFGIQAAKDQEIVEELEDWGAEWDDLPEDRDEVPRAGGKARPGGEP